MTRTLCPAIVLCLLPAATAAQSPPSPMRLGFRQAIELAASPERSPSVGWAEESAKIAEARLAQAHALFLPTVESLFGVQNVTRNLAAQGFTFATGPLFTIPEKVGPFNTIDVRLFFTQNVYDASALRRSRGLKAGIEAARAEVSVSRERAAAQAARAYLAALRTDAAIEAAQAGVTLAEALLRLAEERQKAGKAAAVEVTRARLRLAVDRRKLAAARTDRDLAYLQLAGDLNLDLGTPLELTDRLRFGSDEAVAAVSVEKAFDTRPDLQLSERREAEARDNDSAIRLEALPSVIAFGDLGPLDSIVTHTYAVSVKIPMFDGGRRAARRQETLSTVRQYETQQRDLRRQIELQLRRASANLQAAAAAVADSDAVLALAEEELSETRRRFEGGVTGNIEVIEAQARLAQARDERLSSVFSWNQARVDLAEASGSAAALALPERGR